MNFRLLTIGLCVTLLALQLVWQLGPFAEIAAISNLAKALLILPIALACSLFIADRPSAGFWSGVFALFYFSHGVMELWAVPATRFFSIAEIALSVGIILTASWPGLKARFSRKSNSDV